MRYNALTALTVPRFAVRLTSLHQCPLSCRIGAVAVFFLEITWAVTLFLQVCLRYVPPFCSTFALVLLHGSCIFVQKFVSCKFIFFFWTIELLGCNGNRMLPRISQFDKALNHFHPFHVSKPVFLKYVLVQSCLFFAFQEFVSLSCLTHSDKIDLVRDRESFRYDSLHWLFMSLSGPHKK